MDESNLQDLLSRYVEGTLSEEEARQLESLLQDQPEGLDEWSEQVLVDRLLKHAHRTPLNVEPILKALPSERLGSRVMRRIGAEDAGPGAPPHTAPHSGPATLDSGRATRDPVSPTRDAAPEIHYGTGIQKFVKDKDAARTGSSQGLRSVRRGRPSSLERPLWPIFLAAGVMVAVTLWLALGRGGGLTSVVPPSAQQEPKAREAFEKNRLAQEELARRDEDARRAREKFARAEAERRKVQEQLAELERKRQELAEAQRKAQEGKRTGTEFEAQRQELARLEAEQKAESARLAQAETQAREAQAEEARTEAQRQAAERKLAVARRRAEDLGRVIFVVELKKEAGSGTGVPPVGVPSGPILVRNEGGQTTRTPLAKDMKLLKGDRIETGKSEKTEKSALPNPRSAIDRPVHAAVELYSGATVDLADATRFELTSATAAQLDAGLLFAEVSGLTEGGTENPKATAEEKWTVTTPYAHAEVEQARFDLCADAQEAALRVEEGTAVFANAAGQTKLQRLQKSIARKDFAPAPASVVQAEAFWGGRRKSLRDGAALAGHWTLDEAAGPRAEATHKGLELTPVGAVEPGPGRIGGAARLNGAGHLELAAEKSAGLDGLAALTVCAWVELGPARALPPDPWDRIQILVSKYGFSVPDKEVNQRSWRLELSEERQLRWTLSGDGQTQQFVEGRTGLVPERWHHAAATFEGVSGTAILYLDGELENSARVKIERLFRAQAPFAVGVNFRDGKPVQHLAGCLDEVRVYTRALTQAEIRALAKQNTRR